MLTRRLHQTPRKARFFEKAWWCMGYHAGAGGYGEYYGNCGKVSHYRMGKVESQVFLKALGGNEDYGLYQILGFHPVFGNNSLLYVGMARDQDFKTRFGQHEDWLKNEWDVHVYVGKIKSIAEKTEANYHGNEWRSVVKDAEALLIFFHSPPYNSQHISETPKPSKNLRIINVGDCGELYPEISHIGLGLYR